MKPKKRLVAFAASLMMISVVVAGNAPSAFAGGSGYVLDGIPVQDNHWPASPVVWTTTYPAWLYFDCYADSPYYPFYRYMRIAGSTDFIRTAHIDPEPGGLPKCQ